jgi:hypothetical protein
MSYLHAVGIEQNLIKQLWQGNILNGKMSIVLEIL